MLKVGVLFFPFTEQVFFCAFDFLDSVGCEDACRVVVEFATAEKAVGGCVHAGDTANKVEEREFLLIEVAIAGHHLQQHFLHIGFFDFPFLRAR